MSGEMLTLAFAANGDNDNGPEPYFDLWADGDDHTGHRWIDGVHGITDLEVACERLGIDRSALVDITDQHPSPPFTAAWRFPAEALR